MTATGTKRAHEAVASKEEEELHQHKHHLPRQAVVVSQNEPTASTPNNTNIKTKMKGTTVTTSSKDALAIPRHSQTRRHKRTKVTQLRENRRIHKAAAAMEEQLASFDQQTVRRAFRFVPDIPSSSEFEVSDAVLVSESFSCNDNSEDNIRNGNSNNSDECELAALAQSLGLEDESSSSSSYGGGGHRRQRQGGHRRRGGISIVMAPP